MITQLLRKQFFCVADVRAIEESMCNWRIRRKYLVEGPELNKTIPARKPV